jgi:hypothetical protein
VNEYTQDIWGQEIKLGDMVLREGCDLRKNQKRILYATKVIGIPRKGQVITDEAFYHSYYGTKAPERSATKFFLKYDGEEEVGRKMSEKFLIFSQDFIDNYVAKGLPLCDLYRDMQVDYRIKFIDNTMLEYNSDGVLTPVYN